MRSSLSNKKFPIPAWELALRDKPSMKGKQ
jgi:hypothetical protein